MNCKGRCWKICKYIIGAFAFLLRGGEMPVTETQRKAQMRKHTTLLC